jgi:hypothetical protein
MSRDLVSSISGSPEMSWSHTLIVGSVTSPGKSQVHEIPDVMLISEMTVGLIPKSVSASLSVSSALSQNRQSSPT